MSEKLTGKLTYIEKLEKLSCKYDKLFDNDVQSIDTSDMELLELKFERMFPTVWKYSKRTDKLFKSYEKIGYNGNKRIHCIDLNLVLKNFAILNGYTFNGKEIDKKEIYSFRERFKYTNQMHYTNGTTDFLDATPFSVIFALAENEYQAWLTLYCLLIKIPCIFANMIVREYKMNYRKNYHNWSENLATFNSNFLYNKIFLPQYREKAKRIFEETLTDKYINQPLSNYDMNIIPYKQKTRTFTYMATKNSIYRRLYAQILYFIATHNYEVFSLYIKVLTYNESRQCLLNNNSFINRIQTYFSLNNDKNIFLKEFIKDINSKDAYNLFCFIRGDANEEILTIIIKKLNRTKTYIKDNILALIINELHKKYPNNEEINKYIAKRLMLEILE